MSRNFGYSLNSEKVDQMITRIRQRLDAIRAEGYTVTDKVIDTVLSEVYYAFDATWAEIAAVDGEKF